MNAVLPKPPTNGNAILISLVVLGTFLLMFFVSMLSSCTLSFQNISTHGNATDLVDEAQTSNPNISPDIEIPLGDLL